MILTRKFLHNHQMFITIFYVFSITNDIQNECVNTVSLCMRLQYCQSCQSVDFPSLLCLHMPSAACAHAQ